MKMQYDASAAREVDVIVVGAGHNGLTAACYLAQAGLEVLVLEASDKVGGMTATNPTLPEAPEHRFNEGAIQLTGVFRLSQITQELDLQRYGLREIVVNPAHLQLASDGTSLAIWKDPRRTAQELERFSKSDARAWLELNDVLNAVMPTLIAYMRNHPTRVLSWPLIKSVCGALRHPKKLGAVAHFLSASQADFLDELFETSLPKSAIALMATYQPPVMDMTAAMAIIYLGVVQRIENAMPIGGTGELPKALHRCLEAHGGTVRTSAPVDEVIVRGPRAIGVKLDSGEVLRARHGVMAACNAKIALLDLLADDVLPRRLRRRAEDIPVTKTLATSLKINVALHGKLSVPLHARTRGNDLDPAGVLAAWHTFDDLTAAWTDILHGEWPNPVPVGCAISPTHVDVTQGPDKQDTFWLWSGFLPVFPRQPWDEVRDKIGQQTLTDAAHYYEGLDTLEIAHEVLGGPDIERRFNAPYGNVYHVDPLPSRFGPLKPAIGFGAYKTPVEGFYLTGASCHPTGGVCGLPGKLAAQTLVRTERTGATPRRRQLHVRSRTPSDCGSPS